MFTLSHIWCILSFLGLIIVFTGLFLYTEYSKYTDLTEATILTDVSLIGKNHYYNIEYTINTQRYSALIETVNDNNVGDKILIKYNPSNPQQSIDVNMINKYRIASIILVSIGLAILSAFLMTYFFVPNKYLR